MEIVNADAKRLEFENRFFIDPLTTYAKLYGLCQRTVAEIQKKLTWKHVADQPEIGSEGRDQ